MEYLITQISLPILIQDTASILLSILMGFLIWTIKKSYDQYHQEIALLKQLEICLSGDLATNSHNKEYLESWVEKLGEDKIFSCSFRAYKLKTSDFENITNPKLINELNTLSFSLGVLFSDLKNIYDTYSSSTAKLLDRDHVDSWKDFNKNTTEQLSVFNQNFRDSAVDIKKAVAHIRAYYKQRRSSTYRLLSVLSYNVYPKLTDESIQAEIDLLEKKEATREGSK